MGCCSSSNEEDVKKPENSRLRRKSKGEISIKAKDFVKFHEEKIIKNYELGKTLWDGGFYEVRLGTEKKTGAQRAVKSILLGTKDSHDIDKLLEEVEVLKKLDHPNIIKVYEVYHDQLYLHIVTELCLGGELFEKMGQMLYFSEIQAAKFMKEILSAVNHCHSVGVVHGDLRPENILFENDSPDAKLKLVGFKQSQFIKPNEKLTKFTGTSYFTAPEVISGSYDNKCDIWSLGILLYIMLSGLVPYKAKSERSLYEKIQEKPISFKDPAWDSISKEAKNLIKWMLNKKPLKRPSIDEILEHEWIKQKSQNATEDSPTISRSLINLAAFNISNKLQKATLTFIVSHLSTNAEIAQLRSIFQSLDENGDGKLSEEELKKGFKKVHQVIKMDLHELMAKCDLDNNGYIEYTEFLTAAMDWRKSLNKEKLYNVFKIYDNDNNGKISLDDLKESLGGNERNHYDFIKILKEADINGDGEIDFDEFAELMLNKLSEKEESEPNRI
ncbi:unnamed protein product [Blepharisma stoltei]|uniref:non-specific serine/threonine protein kinase n=1 Tax=Blepharisma stoltei TaxID=1481888 RepID=A0AAU9KH42_9CILI|nr:unnamed protein product [Blepharisma stoltei]